MAGNKEAYQMLYEGKKLWMPDMVEEGLRRGGDNPFVLYRRADGHLEQITYRTIKEEGDALLQKLQEAGVKKGDRLSVITALRPVWYSILYAALKGGYRMVCIDPGVPSRQVRKMVWETESRAVLTSLSNFRLPHVLEGRIPVYSVEPGFPLINDCPQVDKLLLSASEMPEDTFFILFSSGTTGENRKGVLLPHTTVTRAIEGGMSRDAGVYRNETSYSIRRRDFMLFPPYHIAGLLCAVFDIYNNTEVIMLERLTPGGLAAVLQELKPDNICTVPSMLALLRKKVLAELGKKGLLKVLVLMLLAFCGFLRRVFGIRAGRVLLKSVNRKVFGGNLKGLMIGGSPCDYDTMKFYLDLGIDVSIAYGLTELGAPLAVSGKGYYPGTTGPVMRHDPEMDIRVVRPDEKGRGEVEIRSPYRMLRYLRPEDMEGCFTEDNYFRTGDLGYFDRKNCLVICGRAKETIVLRSGEKLLPEEIEARYQNLKHVSELSVFKIPDEGGCDTFGIAVVKAKDCGLPDERIRIIVLDHAATLEQSYRPKDVYVIRELPLSSSHKVQRFRLTDMAVNGQTDPVNEASMHRIDENETVGELRRLLVKCGGVQWAEAELTPGTPLELSSLQMMDLFISVQEHYGIDMFTLATQPETFGQLLDAVENFDVADKNNKPTLDLKEYPKPATKAERALCGSVEQFAKMLYRVRGIGVENIPKEGNFLLCSNHVTVLDPGWICSCMTKKQRDNTCIVGKSELVDDKALKNLVRSHNLIPVDRTGNALVTLDRCRELLEEGWNILIFPEGTNYENATTMLGFKEGPARLAMATGLPIVPVHIKGVAHADMEKDVFLPPLGGKVEVAFGKPIDPANLDPAGINARLRQAIEAL